MKFLRHGYAGLMLGWNLAAYAQTAPASTGDLYQFRLPRLVSFRVPSPTGITLLSVPPSAWVKAWPKEGSTNSVELGNRVVLKLSSADGLLPLIEGSPLRLSRTIASNLFILQAPDVRTALSEAQRLAQLPEVVVCYPVLRRQVRKHGPYAAPPNDPYFTNQWPLENRASNGVPLGADLNVRAAWPLARGDGVTIAVVDDGVELNHPEFIEPAADGPHFDFVNSRTNGGPSGAQANHATAVAGLALARGENFRGIAGVAPRARLASWVIFGDNDVLPSDEQMMDMFQFHLQDVAVQNHSWGNAGSAPLGPSPLEEIGVSNAVTFGRHGRGVVMVRSGGNGRQAEFNSDDDGYISNPWVIAVGAIRRDGHAASFSNPGACLLVAAPSGDPDEGFPGLFTTDRQGINGYNSAPSTNDLADYAFGDTGFSGTSASAPHISGLVALMLSANPNLGYRDVQQVLILSARQFDLAHPGLITNGAGFRVSHDTGYGVPDAAVAVALAQRWINRPPQSNLVFTATNQLDVPTNALQLVCLSPNLSSNRWRFLAAWSSFEGPYPDRRSPVVPLVYVGLATNAIATNLTGKAALIERGTNYFINKIQAAAQAGAVFAVVFNNRDTNQLVFMAGTEYAPIPAVFIGQNDGESLRDLLLSNISVNTQIRLTAATYAFTVPDTLLCEHVGVKVTAAHPHRGELRLTVTSPQGTCSVLQKRNGDTSPGPTDWTYYSTHHFFESSAGTWNVSISNETGTSPGTVQSITLLIHGVPIQDSDHDGLDDAWEMAHFQTLAYGPQDDPDADGYSNAREQIMGTKPMVNDTLLQLDLSRWNTDLSRLSWPGTTNQTYGIWGGESATAPLTLITNMPGVFPQTEWFMPYANQTRQFFRVRAEKGP